jgi:hypothetical protein
LSSCTTTLHSVCLLGLTGGWGGMIGVVDVEVVEPRGEKIGGEREAG